jgi:chemotaxis protein CheY-P-specific phosphatase CheC
MSHNNYHEILLQTSQKVFEDTAFAFIDPPEEEEIPALSSDLFETYEIHFSGPFSGSLSMALEKPLPLALAASMLGTENDDPEVVEKHNDAMGEILNIICGNILPLMAGPQAEFALESPSVVTLDTYLKGRSDGKKQGFVSMMVESLKAEIYLLLAN